MSMKNYRRIPVLTSVTPWLVAADVLAVLAGGAVVHDGVTAIAVLGAVVGTVLVNRGVTIYQSRLVLSVLEDLPALVLAAVVGCLLLIGLAGSAAAGTLAAAETGVTFVVVTSAALVLLRGIAYALVRAGRRHGVLAHPVIIVGTDVIGRRLARSLLADPSLGLTPVGMVEDVPSDRRSLPAPYLGRLGNLPNAMRDLGAHDVILAFGNDPDADERMLSVIRHVQQRDAQVFVVPRFFELMGLDRPSRVEVVDDVSLVRLRRWRAQPHRLLVKRAVDVVVAGVALVLAAPLLAIIALAVRIETGPGVIFRQERIGRDERPFQLLKFRSMVTNRRESATLWNIDNDARIGPVGRLLRRTGLDELPQLWNILRGDMSLVGPRPERPHFVEQFSETTPGYSARHRLHAGLTGWAQVHHLRGDTSIADRARADNYYIENWSLWGDIKIMVRTVGTIRRPQPPRASTMELIGAFESSEGSARPA